MEQIRALPLVLALASTALVCAPVKGQTPQNGSETQFKVKQVRETARPMPFPPDGEGPAPGRVYAIEFRSPGQMTQKDRDVEADGESSIRERTNFEGLGFNEGAWSYQQLVCPALPHRS